MSIGRIVKMIVNTPSLYTFWLHYTIRWGIFRFLTGRCCAASSDI